jgi:hypothetical protein
MPQIYSTFSNTEYFNKVIKKISFIRKFQFQLTQNKNNCN